MKKSKKALIILALLTTFVIFGCYHEYVTGGELTILTFRVTIQNPTEYNVGIFTNGSNGGYLVVNPGEEVKLEDLTYIVIYPKLERKPEIVRDTPEWEAYDVDRDCEYDLPMKYLEAGGAKYYPIGAGGEPVYSELDWTYLD